MTKRTTSHATFVIERELQHPPAKVFAAYSNQHSKAKWFVGPEEWRHSDHQLDFRVGGKESVSGGLPHGPVHKFNGEYWDIIENERIVIAYEMHMDDTRTSISLGTTEFKPAPIGTRLIYTEQCVFLDGHDNVHDRERGTQDLLNQLETFLSI